MQSDPDHSQNESSERLSQDARESRPQDTFINNGSSNDNVNSPSFAQHLDIETLLMEEERNESSSPDNNDDNNTAISSLPPFGDGMRRASFDFSSIGSSLGNLVGSHISLDDDSECGPVPSYPASALTELDTPSKTRTLDRMGDSNTKTNRILRFTPGSKEGRPKEVYINVSEVKDDSDSIPTPGKLGAFMGMSRRHKTSDESVGGSSVESNSLSSIFESIGYLKRRNRQPHPSRGLTKKASWKKERGDLYRLISGSPEPRPASFENEREEYLYIQREKRMVNLRAFILMLFLVCILISVIELSSIGDEGNKMLRKKAMNLKDRKSKNKISHDDEESDERNHHHEYNSISMHLASEGIPKGDERPVFVHNEQEDKAMTETKKTIKQERAIPEKVLFTLQNNLSGVEIPMNNEEDTPFLWNIPESGNDLILDVFSTCKSFKVAGTIEQNHPSLSNSKLQVITMNEEQVINVDLSSPVGIKRAKKLGLIPSSIANIIITPIFIDSLTLFDESHRGRAFTMMRDPIDRSISLYKHLQSINDPNISGMNLQSYARSQYVENNWMVRNLTGRLKGELTTDDLEFAKDILRRKFIIGLFDKKGDSLERFESFFGISYAKEKVDDKMKKCTDEILKQRQSKDSTKLKQAEKKSTIHSLEWQNKLDMELYEFSKELYQKQGDSIIGSIQ